MYHPPTKKITSGLSIPANPPWTHSIPGYFRGELAVSGREQPSDEIVEEDVRQSVPLCAWAGYRPSSALCLDMHVFTLYCAPEFPGIDARPCIQNIIPTTHPLWGA